MKRVSSVLPLVCILLLVATGASLPGLASRLLDRRLEQQPVLRENAPFSLELAQDTDFFHTLELIRSQQTQVDLTEGKGLTSQEAEAQAEHIMLTLSANGMVYTTPAVTPVFITNAQSLDPSGIYWKCVWTDAEGRQEILWLDDQSGRMVALYGRYRETSVEQFLETESYPPTVLNILEYCRKQYPADDVTIRTGKQTSTFREYEILLTRTANGLAESQSIPLILQGEWLYFNL